jgi:phospholipid-binding lipoprotein MlaA
LLAGCATASLQALAANDPYEPFNREALKRNAKIDTYIVIPTVEAYFSLVPEDGRRGVHNFLGNLALPTIFLNDMMQGEVSRAGKSMWRLTVNSTVGLGGFLDPASKMGIPGHGEDFGQTLAVWGVGEGPYLILPLLGPSNPRGAGGGCGDRSHQPDPLQAAHLVVGGTRVFHPAGPEGPNIPNHPGHPAQLGGLLFIPAQPLSPDAQPADPQWPQGW